MDEKFLTVGGRIIYSFLFSSKSDCMRNDPKYNVSTVLFVLLSVRCTAHKLTSELSLCIEFVFLLALSNSISHYI